MTDFNKNIKLKAKGTSKTASDITKVKKSVNSLEKGVGSMIKKFAGFAGVAIVVKKVTDSIKKMTELSIAQEKIFRELQTAVELQGKSYKDEKDALDELFKTQQAYTQFGDTDSAAMLTKLIHFSGDYEQSVKALSLTQDLASAGLFDASAATRYMGLALAGNVEMLGRYIPELKAGSEEMKGLTTKTEKVNKALEILEDKFGGTARKNIENTAGAIKQLKNYSGDYWEMLGDKLNPAVKKGAVLLKEWFARATETSLETTIRQLGELGASAEQLARLQSMADVENYFNTYAENVQKVEKQYKKLGISYDKDVLAILGKGVVQIKSATQGVNEQLKIYDELTPNQKKYNSSLANMVNMTASNVDHWKEVVVVTNENKLTIGNLDKAIELLTDKSITYGSQWKKATESGRKSLGEQISQNAKQIRDLKELRNILVKIEEDEKKFNEATGNTTTSINGQNAELVETKEIVEDIVDTLNSVSMEGVISGLGNEIQQLVADMENIVVTTGQLALGAGEIWENVVEGRFQKELRTLKESYNYKKADVDKREKLEQDLNEKYAEERRKQAEFQKGASLAEAVINTALSVTKVAPNPIAMALAGALGAVQVGIIASQPIPSFAEGGMLPYNGKAQLFMANEVGQESILNARATSNLGKAGIDAINSGQTFGDTIIQLNVQGDLIVDNDERVNQIADKIEYLSKKGHNNIAIKQ